MEPCITRRNTSDLLLSVASDRAYHKLKPFKPHHFKPYRVVSWEGGLWCILLANQRELPLSCFTPLRWYFFDL